MDIWDEELRKVDVCVSTSNNFKHTVQFKITREPKGYWVTGVAVNKQTTSETGSTEKEAIERWIDRVIELGDIPAF